MLIFTPIVLKRRFCMFVVLRFKWKPRIFVNFLNVLQLPEICSKGKWLADFNFSATYS